jgi:hypothetical protein
MPESNLNRKTQIRHLLKVICGFDTGFIKQQKYCNNRNIVKILSVNYLEVHYTHKMVVC